MNGQGEDGRGRGIGGGWGRGEWVNTVGKLSSFLLNLYTLKCAKIRVRDTTRLFEDYRDFAHRDIKTPSRQMREDAKTFTSVQLCQPGFQNGLDQVK